MANEAPATEIQIEPNGSIALPEELRRAIGVAPGDRLLAHVEQGQLILERREQVERRLRERFAHVPKGVSLADELIRERRAEARREATPRLVSQAPTRRRAIAQPSAPAPS